jgi:hypothetical protein
VEFIEVAGAVNNNGPVITNEDEIYADSGEIQEAADENSEEEEEAYSEQGFEEEDEG